MKKSTFSWPAIGLLLILGLYGCAATRPAASVKTEIEQMLQVQSQAWNRGDLEAFMAPYWKSDSLVFVGHSGPTFGWDQTLRNYQRSYPSPEAMGQLTFTLLHLDPLGKDVLLVVGKWHLNRRMGDLQGHFSLVFRKIAGKWLIVADHSS